MKAEKSFGSVYLFENVLDHKKYVGQSIDPEKRKKYHLKGADRNWDGSHSYLYCAMLKHGKHNFRYSILKECSNREEMNLWEIFYISQLNCRNHGYNILTGGGLRKGGFPETSLKKMSKSQQSREKEKKTNTYIGVRKMYFKFAVRIRINGDEKNKLFYDEIEAAETYDKLVLFIHGVNARLNFPKKKELYLKEDLQKCYDYFIGRSPRRSNKFVGTRTDKNGRFYIKIYDRHKRIPTLKTLGYETEEEAAKIADKIMFFYKKAPIHKLNFPEFAKEFNEEELGQFFEKLKTKDLKRNRAR